MERDKAGEIPDGFVQERRVVVDHRARRVLQAHLEKGVGHGAVGLAVHEVAPAAEDLADQHRHGGQVQHRARGELLRPAHDEQRDHAADDAAVDGQPALPDIQGGDGVVGIQVPVEHAVIDPRADDADGHHPQNSVEDVVLHESEARGPVHHVEHREQEARRDDDAVPVDVLAEDRKGHGAGIDRDAEVGERDRRKQKHGWYLPHACRGRMTEIAARFFKTFSRRNCSASSAVRLS